MKSLITLALYTLLISTANSAPPKQLMFGVTNIYPYANIINGNISAERPGSSVEFVKLVQARLGLQIKIRSCPAKRCFILLQDGQLDGMPMASFSEKRFKKYAAYPMKNGQLDTQRKNSDGSYYLYILKNSTVTWNGKHIKNALLPIGFNLGFSISTLLEKQNIKVLGNSSVSANMDMLLAKRLSGVASFKMAAETVLRKSKRYQSIIKIPTPLKYKPYFTILSHQFVKKNPKLSEKIWDTASEVARSKDYQNIIKKYQK